MIVAERRVPAPDHADGNRAHIGPCLALVVLNVAAALMIAGWLLGSGVLPIAMAAHGALMITAWGCLLPLGGMVARYFKVTPRQDFPRVVENTFWWTCHRTLQYAGAALATAAVATILWQTGGQVDTLHGRCGLTVMAVTWLQLASPLFRGSKGGPTGSDAVAGDPGTWRGDHFDMTRRRRLFEAWHKPAGWLLIASGQATILLGLDLVDAPAWVLGVAAAMMAALGLALLDSHLRGRWVDTYEALWGLASAPVDSTVTPVRTAFSGAMARVETGPRARAYDDRPEPISKS